MYRTWGEDKWFFRNCSNTLTETKHLLNHIMWKVLLTDMIISLDTPKGIHLTQTMIIAFLYIYIALQISFLKFSSIFFVTIARFTKYKIFIMPWNILWYIAFYTKFMMCILCFTYNIICTCIKGVYVEYILNKRMKRDNKVFFCGGNILYNDCLFWQTACRLHLLSTFVNFSKQTHTHTWKNFTATNIYMYVLFWIFDSNWILIKPANIDLHTYSHTHTRVYIFM